MKYATLYRLGYGDDQPEDGETVLSFEDLYKPDEADYMDSYRADIPGTVNYQHKQEAAGATWMDAGQKEQFRRICTMIDTIKSGRDFYRVMDKILQSIGMTGRQLKAMLVWEGLFYALGSAAAALVLSAAFGPIFPGP